MENNQSIRDVIDSILIDVNVNNQIESTLNLIFNQSIQINKVEDDIDVIKSELEKKQSKEKYRFHWFLWGIVIILLAAIFCSQIPYLQIKDNYVGLTIGFIGILATFVVVSNYAQVKEVKDEIDAKVKESKSESINRDIEITTSICKFIYLIKDGYVSNKTFIDEIKRNEANNKILFDELIKIKSK